MKESKVNNRTAIYSPGSKGANNRGYILKYRYLMSKYLGRDLDSNEYVHHINGNKYDDRIENLTLMSASEHTKFHIENGDVCIGKRKLDYDAIRLLMEGGFGYKKISKILGYKTSSVSKACRTIRKEKATVKVPI